MEHVVHYFCQECGQHDKKGFSDAEIDSEGIAVGTKLKSVQCGSCSFSDTLRVDRIS